MKIEKFKDIIEYYSMLPHPEGGYYCTVFDDPIEVLSDGTALGRGTSRALWNNILFLIPYGSFSCFHRIPMNESWHFYRGDSMDFYEIDENGDLSHSVLGSQILNGEKIVHVVAKRNWMAARPRKGEFGYSLVGCLTCPGFLPNDLEIASSKKLISIAPKQEKLINSLCRNN